MTCKPPPSPERVRELLDYDPDTGMLTWKRRTGRNASTFNKQRAGRVAGTLRSDGYVAVKIDDVIHAAHRLIWAMVYDEWPECVRHRNRDDADNRLENLAASSRREILEQQRIARIGLN